MSAGDTYYHEKYLMSVQSTNGPAAPGAIGQRSRCQLNWPLPCGRLRSSERPGRLAPGAELRPDPDSVLVRAHPGQAAAGARLKRFPPTSDVAEYSVPGLRVGHPSLVSSPG